MNDRENLPDEYVNELRDAVEASAAVEAEWTAFHVKLNAAVSARLADLRSTVATGAAWWDYTARAGLAAVPLGLAAALLLFVHLRNGSVTSPAPETRVAMAASSSDAARAAFESVFTGVAAPKAVIGALLPAPSAAFLGDSSGGGAR